MGLVGIYADLQAEVADLVLYEPVGYIGKEVFVAFCLSAPGVDLQVKGGGQGELIILECFDAPIDDFCPIFVLCNIDRRRLIKPGGDIGVGIIGPKRWVGPGVGEGIILAPLGGFWGIVYRQDAKGAVCGGENSPIIVTDGGGRVERKVIGVFGPENGIEANNRISHLDPVSFANIFQGKVRPF